MPQFKRGDWIRCYCSHEGCDVRGMVLSHDDDGYHIAAKPLPDMDWWYADCIQIKHAKPMNVQRADEVELMKAVVRGEVTI